MKWPFRSGSRQTPPTPATPARTSDGWLRLQEPLMGTSVSVELWHEDAGVSLAAAHAVMAEYHRINELMSTYREDSEISALNREAGKAPFVTSAELFDLVARSMELGRLSEGGFDITYDGIGQLYDLRAGVVPDDSERERRLRLIDYRAVKLDHSRSTIHFEHPGMRINLGGIAKGYAVERGAAILRERGIRHAILNAGGDSRVVGDRRGQPWMIGVRDPRDEKAVVARLPLVDEAVSTAGDYERYFDRDGVRWHHILDPRTGLPSRGIHGVTVIGPDATMTDGLDTAIFVIGVKKGMALIASLPGYEAVIIDDHGRLYYSPGLQAPPAS